MIGQSGQLRHGAGDVPLVDTLPVARTTSQYGRPFWLPRKEARLAAFFAICRQFPFLAEYLEASHLAPIEAYPASLDGIIAWGGRLPARLAHAYAELRGLPHWTLEDGFLRSVGLGSQDVAVFSLTVDDIGAHFSPASPSRLELLIASRCNSLTAGELARARAFRDLIVGERLSKYNYLPDKPVDLGARRRRRILIVDQVRGDASVGREGARAFARLWQKAQTENAELIIRRHPAASRKRGYLSDAIARQSVHVLDDAVSPHAVLDAVDEVWTVSSQLGLDALLRDIPVTTFGAPFYAGWGLTRDFAADPASLSAFERRRTPVTIDSLVAVALLQYPVYFDPVHSVPVTPEKAIERLVALRNRVRELAGRYLCVGFARHKRRVLQAYLGGPSSRIEFRHSFPSKRKMNDFDYLVIWGKSSINGKVRDARPIIHVEDGFVRSVGLGSDKALPSSLCFDSSTPHFDSVYASDLETLLNTADFNDALLRRAERLRRSIVASDITKYNLGESAAPDYRALADGRPIVVVAGQVPGDASLHAGRALHRSNVALLATVRRLCADAYVIYKEHPDLIANNRPGRESELDLYEHADLVVGTVPVGPLLGVAEQVHVATSQLGFEALLRERKVFCHGLPFYAGWGLTRDLVSPLRDRRRLDLNALVAGALILYPKYFNWKTRCPCEVEDVVGQISGARAQMNMVQQALDKGLL